ncbi:hypothetical protein SDRG_11381 [Saprolegnia diclina VS20]|uniref:PX domain-containing protein n=1 Tax=Saprolegnia diclina (strain VS20) TaxID=1156394 RepID=T0QBJ5_SAPDV|nr:hypothetical protein SDRG_11381 [Saprolegnia diclina VS20]EQC30900.1 hypothetical protein SDRG_11381 [Saprolegnia diclina VS20]|eukprot:XP_008615638.1 hypothetical protein SDRG_11381 [Saprolegnia diclina VS20]
MRRFLPRWLQRAPTPSPKASGPSSTVDTTEAVVVNFVGLVIVQGATEQRQLRYDMELIVPETRRKTQCSKRYSQFVALRNALLSQIQAACACRRCAAVRTALKAVPFPSRRWPARVGHMSERALPLERFLQHVLDVALAYPGCARSKKGFHDTTSHFIGAPVCKIQPTHALDFRTSLRSLLVLTQLEVALPTSLAPESDASCAHEVIEATASAESDAAADVTTTSPPTPLQDTCSCDAAASILCAAQATESDADETLALAIPSNQAE